MKCAKMFNNLSGKDTEMTDEKIKASLDRTSELLDRIEEKLDRVYKDVMALNARMNITGVEINQIKKRAGWE